ncbi:hypothetical protein LCM17_23465 [Cereibacter sphaeroides]|nr:hypothetical protein [Cereibacter sphaeroides]
MAVRTPLASDPTGPELITHVNARNKSLFDAARFTLTDVAGTANAVTATLDPGLDGDGLIDGMTFGITWAAVNTGGVTLAINGGTALAVLDGEGNALAAGALSNGLRSTIEYVGGSYRLLSPSSEAAAVARYNWLFTASGTWNAPDLPDDTPVFVEAWGGGGGGHTATPGGGGGGGGYAARMFRLGDLPSSVTCSIGSGGAAGAAGGNTTFGAFLTAYRGGRGHHGSGSPFGGGGGGTSDVGTDATSAIPGNGGFQGGGGGGQDAGGLHGGAGGGSGEIDPEGGQAVYGGAGGGASLGGLAHSGGTSKHGGAGGDGGVAGSAPGGGGGAAAPGARGEIRIWI